MTRYRRCGLLGLLAAAAVVVACQPVDRLPPPPAADGGVGDDVLGNPDEDLPRALPALLARGSHEAEVWQDEPVLVDATVWLDPAGAWERARLTYLAPLGDRLFVLRLDEDGAEHARPSLAGLQLPSVPEEALAEVPELPADALPPEELGPAAADALAACEVSGPVRAVLYATGAPGAWDGERWTAVPVWRATAVAESGGAVVDPRTGVAYAPLVCVEPLLLQAG